MRRDQRKDIRRGEWPPGPPALEKIDHCLSGIQRQGFADGVDWKTQVAPAVTVEELVGALVHAEMELEGTLETPAAADDPVIDCADCGDPAEAWDIRVTRPGHPIGAWNWICPACADAHGVDRGERGP